MPDTRLVAANRGPPGIRLKFPITNSKSRFLGFRPLLDPPPSIRTGSHRKNLSYLLPLQDMLPLVHLSPPVKMTHYGRSGDPSPRNAMNASTVTPLLATPMCFLGAYVPIFDELNPFRWGGTTPRCSSARVPGGWDLPGRTFPAENDCPTVSRRPLVISGTRVEGAQRKEPDWIEELVEHIPRDEESDKAQARPRPVHETNRGGVTH